MFPLKKIKHHSVILCLLILMLYPTSNVLVASDISVGASVPAICGNGFVEAPEEVCDDGNNTDGDGCNATCGAEQANGGGGGVLIPPSPPAPDPDPEPEPDPDPQPQPDPDPEPEPEPDPQPEPNPNPEEPGDDNPDDPNNPNGQEGENDSPDNENDPNSDNPVDSGGSQGSSGSSGGGGQSTGSEAHVDISLDVFSVFLGNARIPSQITNNTINSLVGEPVLLRVSTFDIGAKPVKNISLTTLGQTQLFSNADGAVYELEFVPSNVGTTQALIQVVYQDDTVVTKQVSLSSQGYGIITSHTTKNPLDNVTVTIYDVAAGDVVWNGGPYNQANPFTTQNGSYAILVPNGRYRAEIVAPEYRTRSSVTFRVTDNIINDSYTLIKKEKPLSESINEILSDEQASASQQAQAISQAIENKITEQRAVVQQELADAVKVLQEVADDEQVEAAAERVVVPTAATVVVASVAPSLWSLIVPLLRFVFLQPILLVGRKKRREWGMVYDSITKKPLDLAMIRLINADTKKIVQSRVTDAEGRYIFLTRPGSYLLEVTKPGYVFPSVLLQKATMDGKLLDLYHGEILVTQAGQASITRNIPLDPEGQLIKPKRLLLQKQGRIFQQVLSIAGIVLTGLSVLITPSWFTGGFLFMHLVLYAIFERYVRPKKVKTFAVVRDEKGNAVANVIVRLFTKKYNKLVSSQITDRRGHYSFLVGPETYYMTAEKDGYEQFKSDDIVISDADGNGVVHQDITLKKTSKT